ncbi:MAG TPA: hypothetical protein VGI16_11210 [Candidatus Acidoferrum sp.]
MSLDWRAILPDEKSKVFSSFLQTLEANYTMLSVTLNEAIDLRRAGRLANASQAVCVTPALCLRLTEPLAALLHILGQYAKHYGIIPNAAPLDAENFHCSKDQRAARMSDLLSRVLLSQRSQFLHKVGTLEEIVEDAGKEFCLAAEELAEGTATDPERQWAAMDAGHFDLNTCLREACVLLKSFLLALPDSQVESFEQAVRAQTRSQSPQRSPQRSFIRDGRIPAITGQ